MSIVVNLRYSWRGWRANVHYSGTGHTDSLETYLRTMDLKRLPQDTIVNLFGRCEDKSKLEDIVALSLKASQKNNFSNSALSFILVAIVAIAVSEKYSAILGTAAGLSAYFTAKYCLNQRTNSRIAELDLRVPKENIFLMQS
ncbi:MAG TPA: hypothetical protein HA224_02640 [Nanoarchaeota archaeon]|nr:hypothetical protein [Nanoarchaeota archaeon]